MRNPPTTSRPAAGPGRRAARSRLRRAAAAAAVAAAIALAGPASAGPAAASFLGGPLPDAPAAADPTGPAAAAAGLLEQAYRAALRPLARVAARDGLRPGPPEADDVASPLLLERLAEPLAALRRIADAVIAGSDGPATLGVVTHEIGATVFWAAGITGTGVDVALIDTGVAPVAGLAGNGHLVAGPDLSAPSVTAGRVLGDGFGHGTHLAATIAGRDDGPVSPFGDLGLLRGVAPDARLVDVKVGAADGSVDVDRVVAALDWVVEHGRSGGLDIRVVNLAFGIPAPGGAAGDRLAAAVERAWRAGIVVVAAAGNDGNGIPARTPAGGRFTITVGSADGDGSFLTPDPVSSFTNCSPERPVDLLAPGRSVASLAAPGSEAVRLHPEALVGERMILGTGTSQAAAVVAGAAALLLDQRPGLTPDQVEGILLDSAAPALGSPACTGAGVIDLGAALTAPTPGPTHAPDAGTADGTAPPGPARGASWSGASWSGSSWSGASWSSGSWGDGTSADGD
jgi:serine protease AprX